VRYYIVLSIVLLVSLLCTSLLRSRIGRAWAAVSADELAAASAGVPPGRVKLLAFGLSGAIAGLGGALFATSFGYLTPNLAEFRISALVVIMVVLGGSRRTTGAIVGAVLIASYDLVIISRVGDWFDQLRETTGSWFWSAINPRGSNFLSFGLLLYLTVLYRSRRTAK
jgi:branched-chain amino acid transport system permease protein